MVAERYCGVTRGSCSDRRKRIGPPSFWLEEIWLRIVETFHFIDVIGRGGIRSWRCARAPSRGPNRNCIGFSRPSGYPWCRPDLCQSRSQSWICPLLHHQTSQPNSYHQLVAVSLHMVDLTEITRHVLLIKVGMLSGPSPHLSLHPCLSQSFSFRLLLDFVHSLVLSHPPQPCRLLPFPPKRQPS